jgi:hypothetical protein
MLSFSCLGSGFFHCTPGVTIKQEKAFAELERIARIDIFHLKIGGTDSSWVRLLRSHHRYQLVTHTFSVIPRLDNPSVELSCLLSRFSRTTEPDWSTRVDSWIVFSSLKFIQTSVGQANRRCNTSLGPILQIGYSPDVPKVGIMFKRCSLAKFPIKGSLNLPEGSRC